MNYTIEIYLYDNKLIFTGTRDLYFEKYKGNGPGVYSQPILCLPSSCSISEIQQALLTCVGVLEQNEKKILDENTSNSVTQMESVLFRNFKSFRFLYKGIIIKHNKTEPTYTKTSLFLCEKRRFFMARTEKGVVATI